MNQDMKNFKEKFMLDELIIFESKYWTWSVRPKQPTLGCGVLSLKRHAYKMSDITPEEAKDLEFIIKKIEQTMSKTFGYEIMNYLMLMMVDKHVHYHIIPRYSETKKYQGTSYEDKGWPAIPNLKAEAIEIDLLKEIKNEFLKNL